MSKISISNMNLYYGDFHALKDVNLEIEPNKITAFIGPSGCGKSTLLKSINRMNDLVEGCRIEGDLRLDGKDIYKDIDEIDGNQCKQDIIHPFQHITYLRILGTFPGSPRDIPGQKNIDKDNQAQQQPGILHPKREKQVENGCYAEFNPLFLGKLLHLFLLLIKI